MCTGSPTSLGPEVSTVDNPPLLRLAAMVVRQYYFVFAGFIALVWIAMVYRQMQCPNCASSHLADLKIKEQAQEIARLNDQLKSSSLATKGSDSGVGLDEIYDQYLRASAEYSQAAVEQAGIDNLLKVARAHYRTPDGVPGDKACMPLLSTF